MGKEYYKMIDPPSMSGLIQLVGENFADRSGLSFFDGEGFSYREIICTAWCFAKLLDEKKVNPKAHVMLLSQSSPWWGIAYLGIVGSGRVVVPVLPDFPANDILHIMKHSDSQAAVVSAKLMFKFKEIHEAQTTILMEGFQWLKKLDELHPVSPSDYLNANAKFNFEEAMNYFKAHEVDPDQLCSVIYTSGTTGMSKGVMLSHRNICSDTNSANSVPPKRPITDSLSILPLSHAYECTTGLITPFTWGCHVHYLRRNLSPSTLMPALKKVRPGMMMSVPLLLEKIYRRQILPSLTSTAFKRFIYKIPVMRILMNRIAGKVLMKKFGGKMVFFGVGGVGIDPQVEKFLREAKFPYAMGYGLTETAPLVVASSFWNSRYRSTGHLIPNVEVKIDFSKGNEDEGEILVRGPNVMMGYYKDEQKTAEVISGDGYFRTGDTGYLKGKHLYISGRIKNMILTANGENIYPEAIESIINGFDFVEESLVFQAEDKRLVARIQLNYDDMKKAFAQEKDGSVNLANKAVDHLKQIKSNLNNQLSRFSQIQLIIEQKDSFEKTPTNKIKRHLHNQLIQVDEKNKID